MEFLEQQLATTTEDANKNAHASKCINDLVEAGYLRENMDGSIDLARAEDEGRPFDPMNISNLNWSILLEEFSKSEDNDKPDRVNSFI